MGRSKLPVTVETQQAETEANLAKEFNECINFGGVNSAHSKIEMSKLDLERDSQERKLKENDEELRRCDLNERIIAANNAKLVHNQGVTESPVIQIKKSACNVKESGSCINMPPRINEHMSPCEGSQGKNPRQRTWKRLCQETTNENSEEYEGALHAILPAKRNLTKNDGVQGDQNKKKKLELQNGCATTDLLAEAVTQPRQSQ